MTKKLPITLHADPEHTGLRLVVLLLTLVAFIVSYNVVQLVIGSFLPDYSVVLSCALAIPLGLLIVWIVEQWLKRVWPSGRVIELHDTGLVARTPEGENGRVVWDKNYSWLAWYFQLSGYPRGGRERRVSAKWYCLACQLQQDEQRLVVYTFLPPAKATMWTKEKTVFGFEKIVMADVYEKGWRTRMGPPVRPEIPTEILAGKNGRYWLAERRRWREGFELTPSDFTLFMEYVQSHIPGESPQASTAGREEIE
ncbi:MAG: hypothetical protein D6706_14565 [Chloroflexi bacterium]|nr:MAG: hypothetical protein D6706_14565 [Chloroflexota bacterium]